MCGLQGSLFEPIFFSQGCNFGKICQAKVGFVFCNPSRYFSRGIHKGPESDLCGFISYVLIYFIKFSWAETNILHILIFAWCYCAIICKTLHWQQIWLGSRESNPWLQSHCTDFGLLLYRLCRWALDNKTRLEFTWTMFDLWPAFIADCNCFEFSLGHVYNTTLCMLRCYVRNDEIIHRIYNTINLFTIHGKDRGNGDYLCPYKSSNNQKIV